MLKQSVVAPQQNGQKAPSPNEKKGKLPSLMTQALSVVFQNRFLFMLVTVMNLSGY